MALRFFLQLFVLDGMGHAEHASRRLGEIENSAALAFFSGFHVKFQIHLSRACLGKPSF